MASVDNGGHHHLPGKMVTRNTHMRMQNSIFPSFHSPTPPSKISLTLFLRYMMHRKALLFGGPDDPITLQIQNGCKLHPRTIRDLGRKIPNFSDEVWEQNRYGFVLEGNYLKFSQDEELKQKLLATGNRELVEASPRDRIWGVGFGAANAGANRERWGLNLLGKVLMETRERLVRENSQ